MIRPQYIATIISLLFLAACRTANEIPHSPAADKTPTKAVALAEIEPVEIDETEPTTAPTSESAVQVTAEITETDMFPEPTLFATTWDDRALFRTGLIENEQDILDELAGASIYHLKLTIDKPTSVTGQMEVQYTNMEETALSELYFHLFANQLGGSIIVSDVNVNGQAVQPEIEETVLRVPLETALDPGETTVVAMEFVTRVPPEGESTKYNILAYNEDILALAHFYPMIAAYDDRGWHTEPSPPHGDETYADMSYFLVELTAPAVQVVAATGNEIDRRETGATQTITLAAGPVRDFYLAMSDRYGVVSKQIGAVQINSYAPTELLDGAQWALDVAGEALQSFSERFGPYPYSELDIVSTPTQALGIEYPGIFANALRIYDLTEDSSGASAAILLESVTAHEAAHQWFYNLVGNDQLNEPWLDEATAQYATWMYYIDRYGEETGQQYYNSLEGRWARTDFADIPIGMPAEDYEGQEYGAIVYGRGPIFLNELAETMGQATFDAFLRDYTNSFAWKIASSEDFQALAEAHCACDLSSLFNEAVFAH